MKFVERGDVRERDSRDRVRYERISGGLIRVGEIGKKKNERWKKDKGKVWNIPKNKWKAKQIKNKKERKQKIMKKNEGEKRN